MFAFHIPLPMILVSGLAAFLMVGFGLSPRVSTPRRPVARPGSSQPASVLFLNVLIAILGLVFVACVLLGFVTFVDAHMAFARVQGQPYHATTFQVIRPYYQKSAGFHGPEVSVYASGMVEGEKEWMNLIPYLKRAPNGQGELNALVPTGTVIPVYLFPNLRGRSRIQIIDVLPPGEASRRTEESVLRRVPVALAVTGGLIFLLVRIRRSFASRAMVASA
jgi:hypothetical protein